MPKPDLSSGHVQKGLILSAALLVVVFFYFFTNFLPFFYPPRQLQVKELRANVERLSAEVEQAKRTAENLPRLEAEMAELHTKWEEATRLLPPEKEVATLLRKVTVAGQQAGIEFILFEPSEPVPSSFYTEHSVSVKVEGGYHNLGTFLSGLAGMTRIVNVKDLDVTAKDQDREQNHGKFEKDDTVESSMTITAYSLGSDQVEAVGADANGQANGNEVKPHAAAGKDRRSVQAPNPE